MYKQRYLRFLKTLVTFLNVLKVFFNLTDVSVIKFSLRSDQFSRHLSLDQGWKNLVFWEKFLGFDVRRPDTKL